MTNFNLPSRYPQSVADEFIAAKNLFATENMGKARVCARRAVGFGITARLKDDPRYRGLNAMNAIRVLRAEPDLPAEIANCLDEMVTRVDDQFNLPGTIDLLASARIILDYLFPESDAE